jgi:hypothetical protein
VTWPEADGATEREDQWLGLCWKTRTVVAWAASRPFAWVDDEITEADRDWVSAHHRGHALLRSVDASIGLMDQDLTVLDAWLREIPAGTHSFTMETLFIAELFHSYSVISFRAEKSLRDNDAYALQFRGACRTDSDYPRRADSGCYAQRACTVRPPETLARVKRALERL